MTRVRLYDTTLRDGTQGEGFQLSVAEKVRVAHLLDGLGILWIEGGWPGSNPRDEGFFEAMRSERLDHARLAAFGSTRRASLTCDEDPSIQALLRTEVPVLTVFGKSWRFQATDVLRISPEENLALIHDTVAYLASRVDEVVFDAEHFFDGAADDPAYALAAVRAASEAGASWVVLCDTNGGSLPHVVQARTAEVAAAVACGVGMHAHNDGELAVANSLAAVRGGAQMVQGTINGYGERCGNANLISILPALELKMGLEVVGPERLATLTHVSRMVDELSNNVPHTRQAWVGQSAFAHKGGVHVHAVMRAPAAYEHVDPTVVGNERRVLVSDLSGRSNLAYKAAELGVTLDADAPHTRGVLERIKQLESEGWSFEDADASLRLLMLESQDARPRWFEVEAADVTSSLRDPFGEHAASHSTRAVVRVRIGDRSVPNVAWGNGPVDALGKALHEVLRDAFPVAGRLRLVDYKVRIVDSSDGVGAAVRVLIRASDGEQHWGTVGVSTNVIEASWRAIVDAYEHHLAAHDVPAQSPVSDLSMRRAHA